ncbi:MAG: ribosome biogenesis GTPase A [Myxococcota bacterium]|jgi:ribosome biogenesis GTPase A
MNINWFPGHMNKARRLIGETMSKVSLVIEVLDARLPYSSENPLVPKLRRDTPCIKVLNKRDLADPVVTRQWVAWLERERGVRALPLSRNEPILARNILKLGRELLGEKLWNRTGGVHAMILGIPNVGKSTLINTLAGRKIAKTANKPAVTQHQQNVRISKNLTLLDTPGFLWPRLYPQDRGYRLAASGAIKESVLDFHEIAFWLTAQLRDRYPEGLKARYKLDELPEETEALFEAIARKRGAQGRKGSIDTNRTSEIIINEFRSGKLGRISLERPDEIVVKAPEED